MVKKLPRKGYSQITFTDALKARIKKRAEAEGLSMPGLIRVMLVKCYPEPLPGDGEEKVKEEPQ